MKKIFTLLMIALTLSFQLQAQSKDEVVDATISPDDVEYWIGEGANSVVFAVNWCDPDTALAWGFRFDGDEVTVQEMMDSIAAHDSRFSYEGDASTVNEMTYQDGNISLALTGSYWMYNVNGSLADWGYAVQIISDGDFIKWGDPECADYIYDDPYDWPWIYAWETEITPVSDPNPVVYEDAEISADDVIYWIGKGENEAIMIINWCDPDTALAWGYRFSAANPTVETMLSDIVAIDHRLSYTMSGSFISDIIFTDGNTTFSIAPDWIVYNHNGGYADIIADETFSNGDYIKFGGYTCANVDEYYTSTWETEIVPVTPFVTETFDGIVGTPGCQGIYCKDPAILGWATDCKVTRGLSDITIPDVFVYYGDEADAVGAATENTGDVVSLGDSGVAILTFDIPIQNGDGYDFAVFENGVTDNFLELAFVEVSSDGEHYFRFPAISNTPADSQLTNSGGVAPTLLYNLAGKYRVGWGTPFDLEELAGNDLLDINNVTHVKIIDVIGTIDPAYASRDRFGHIVNDPYPTNFDSGVGGFDLDGVCVLNGWKPNKISNNEYNQTHLSIYPNPCHEYIMVETLENEVVTLYDAQGRVLISQIATSAQTELNLQSIPAGIYFVQCGNRTAKVLKH